MIAGIGRGGSQQNPRSEPLKKPHDRRVSPALLFLITIGYAGVVAYGSFVPLEFRPLPLEEAVRRFREIPELHLSVDRRADWLANLFLYIPLAFLGTLAVARLGRSTGWRLATAVAACVLACCWAVIVEFAQLWFPARTVSQNDLRAEAIGAVVGAVAGCLWSLGLDRAAARAAKQAQGLLPYWGYAYVAIMLLYAVAPADLVLSRAEFQAKLAAGRVNWLPEFSLDVRSLLSRAAQVACFAPAGFLALQRRTRRESLAQPSAATWAVGRGAAAGLLFALLLELVQLPVFSRETSLGSALFGAVGGAIGGGLYHLVRWPERRPRLIKRLATAASAPASWRWASLLYAVAIVVILLAPFEWVDEQLRATRWEGMRRVPFAALYVGTEFDALTNILQKGILFFVLGGMLRTGMGFASRSLFPWFAAIVATAGVFSLGWAIEVGQVYFQAYQPDSTDPLIYAAFAAVGFVAVHRYGRSLTDSPADAERPARTTR